MSRSGKRRQGSKNSPQTKPASATDGSALSRDSGRSVEAKKEQRDLSEIQQAVLVEASGPIPLPHQMAAYREIQADIPERLLGRFEERGRHIEMMKTRQQTADIAERTADSRRRSWGLGLGFVLAAGIVGGGIYGISLGEGLGGGAAIGALVYGVVRIFIAALADRRASSPGGTPPRR